MKKLLQINTIANIGSTGRIVENIGEVAIKKGWESYIACASGHFLNSKSNIIPIGNMFTFYRHALETRLFDNHGLSSENATKGLIKCINKIEPTIIHLHNIHGYYLNYKILFEYLNKINIPVVWTLHDCWPLTGHCSYPDLANCKKWINGCHNCPISNSYPKSWLIDRSRKNWELKQKLFSNCQNLTFIPVSHWINDLLKQSKLSHHSSYVIHNGINIETFSPKENAREQILKKYPCLKTKKIILAAALQWDKRKGFFDILELSKKIDTDKYALIWIGLSDKQLKIVPKNIIALKRTDNIDEMALIYSASDVFINASRIDNYPTTILEAIACGTPVITYDTGGCAESVTQKTGIVVSQGDISAILDNIDLICGNMEQYNNYQENCHKYALEHFDKNICFEKYFNLYQSILE